MQKLRLAVAGRSRQTCVQEKTRLRFKRKGQGMGDWTWVELAHKHLMQQGVDHCINDGSNWRSSRL